MCTAVCGTAGLITHRVAYSTPSRRVSRRMLLAKSLQGLAGAACLLTRPAAALPRANSTCRHTPVLSLTVGAASLAEAMPAAATRLKTLEELQVENTFTSELPGDPDTSKRTRQVSGAFYSFVSPTSTGTEPRLVAYSPEVAELVGLEPSECERPEIALIFSGNAPFPGTNGQTWAQCYGGHQFGMWAGQLGDGRAISLAEVVSPSGAHHELQLKGAGLTPYSRHADGRAVLRSSIREFIGSEAMHALGIPTTRALSLIATGDSVMRDMFYNGNARMEPGAVVCRVSSSFVRFGTFQLPATRQQMDLVKQLADFVIKHHYSHLEGEEQKYVKWLQEVTDRTAHLVAAWQGVGFVHGVLNTDNMSILGETIDYGPFGFLERFDPSYTPNTTDADGRRYSFRSQPEVVQWNLVQLGSALVSAGILERGEAEEVLGSYARVLMQEYNWRMAKKMGLKEYDRELAIGLLTNMAEDDADFTNTFRALSSVTAEGEDDWPTTLAEAVSGGLRLPEERVASWRQWIKEYRAKLQQEAWPQDERAAAQDSVNPCYIPRNHLLQDAIVQAEKGDSSGVHKLMELLKRPYEEQPGADKYRVPAPKLIRMGVEMLSCSS